ncbi:hypothetical protein KR200_011551, partial [Drosophila serrata]
AKLFSRCILVLSSLDVIFVANAKEKGNQKVAEDPHYDYNEIVRNMIRSWEAPVVYLRGRGFLPSDYQDTSKIKPSLDALMQRLDKNKREAKNHCVEGMGPQTVKGTPKERKLSGWEQLQALSTKFSGKRRLDERGGKLMTMKRRLEQLQCGASGSPQRSEIQMNAKMVPVPTPKESELKYDDVLQRMIEKTKPQSGSNPFSFSPQPSKAPASIDGNPVTSAPISLSTYKALSLLPDSLDNTEINMPKSSPPEAQKGNGKEEAHSLNKGLGVPKFLKWDIKTGRLDQYSHDEKEDYLKKLLNVYRPKLDEGDPKPFREPNSA